MEAKAKLFSALVKAQTEIKGIHHDKRNKFHNYDYTSAEAMYDECRSVLMSNGLTLVPVAFDIDALGVDSVATHGAAGIVRRKYILIHVDGGTMEMSQDWPIVPEKGRPVDKATAAADTASLSYVLRNLLLLPRVERGTDLNDDSRDDDKKTAPKTERKTLKADEVTKIIANAKTLDDLYNGSNGYDLTDEQKKRFRDAADKLKPKAA